MSRTGLDPKCPCAEQPVPQPFPRPDERETGLARLFRLRRKGALLSPSLSLLLLLPLCRCLRLVSTVFAVSCRPLRAFTSLTTRPGEGDRIRRDPASKFGRKASPSSSSSGWLCLSEV